MSIKDSDVKSLSLSDAGVLRIEWAS
ncbi:MAG: hypothetical protein HW414_1088, partial [Dehalococcoidia bacterium]|nr:hypothetical protein [Dehalococcoidia bacterium]